MIGRTGGRDLDFEAIRERPAGERLNESFGTADGLRTKPRHYPDEAHQVAAR
jgi:hypothetical protein